MRVEPRWTSTNESGEHCPGAETDQTGHVVQVAGRQADAELLLEVQNL